MNINIKKIALLLLLGFGTISSAYAHNDDDDFFDFFGLSLNFGSPAYYGRPPVYYDTRPVYVEPPRVIYDERPVVRYGYYNTQPYYYDDDYDEHGHGHAYGHYKHHHHEDEDDDDDD